MLTDEQLRDIFVGQVLIKQGNEILGWGLREEALEARGISARQLRRMALFGKVEMMLCGPESAPGIVDQKAQAVKVWFWREKPSAPPMNVAE